MKNLNNKLVQRIIKAYDKFEKREEYRKSNREKEKNAKNPKK